MRWVQILKGKQKLRLEGLLPFLLLAFMIAVKIFGLLFIEKVFVIKPVLPASYTMDIHYDKLTTDFCIEVLRVSYSIDMSMCLCDNSL